MVGKGIVLLLVAGVAALGWTKYEDRIHEQDRLAVVASTISYTPGGAGGQSVRTTRLSHGTRWDSQRSQAWVAVVRGRNVCGGGSSLSRAESTRGEVKRVGVGITYRART